MGNATSVTMENSLSKMEVEHLEAFFNAVSTGRDPADETARFMTKTDFQKQFPSLSQQKLFGQGYFCLFDVEGLDSLDFSSFFAGLAVLINQKVDTKLDALFRLLDPAGNGVLQEYELLGFVEKTFQSLHSLDPTIDWSHPVTIQLSQEQYQLKLSQIPQQPQQADGKPAATAASSPSSLLAPDPSLQYGYIPMAFGPIELCFNSQVLVEKALTSIGKAAPLAIAPLIVKPSVSGSKSSTVSAIGTTPQQSTPSITRSVDKSEFRSFIKACPQLFLTVMWSMSLSSIQYICQQTRLQFIQQCEADLAAAFPMSETQLIENYFRISQFYQEVLLRRLSLNNIKSSLLQSDIQQIQHHFNTEPGSIAANGAATTASAPAPPPESTTPSQTRRRSRFSFSRSVVDESTTDLGLTSGHSSGSFQNEHNNNNNNNNQAPQSLFPKVTQFNYPLTYRLSDSKIQLTPIGSEPPIQITTVLNAGTAQSNLAALPTLTNSPSQHRGSSTRSRADSSVRDASAERSLRVSGSNLASTVATVATFAPAGVSGAGLVRPDSSSTTVLAPFEIPNSKFFPSTEHQIDISTVGLSQAVLVAQTQTGTTALTTTLPQPSPSLLLSPPTTIPILTSVAPESSAVTQTQINFAQKSYPDTLLFTLMFMTRIKLQSLVHRNRLVSQHLCENLMLDVQEDLNDSYVGLIAQQYVYEMKQRYSAKDHTTSGAQHRSNSAYGDINHSLIKVLEQRRQAAAAAKESTAARDRKGTEATPILTSSVSQRGSKRDPVRHFESEDDNEQSVSKSVSKSQSGLRQNKAHAKKDHNSSHPNDPLGLKSLELSTDDSEEFGSALDSDRNDSEEEKGNNNNTKTTRPSTFATPSSLINSNPKTPLSTSKLTSQTSQNGDASIFANDAFSKHQNNVPSTPGGPDSLNDITASISELENPGYSHLMTEALIPTFLHRSSKAINSIYLPNARGPYAMPCLSSFVRDYLPDALGQLLAAYRFVLSKKIKEQTIKDTEALFTDVKDYLDELMSYKQTVQDQFQAQQTMITEGQDAIAMYKSQHEDLVSELSLAKEQNSILKTELTDVISVKDMAIITLRDELQFFTKESQHWSDQIAKLNSQVAQLKQERIQKDVEVAQLRAAKDAGGCCSIM